MKPFTSCAASAEFVVLLRRLPVSEAMSGR
jgi:hypothetical protein